MIHVVNIKECSVCGRDHEGQGLRQLLKPRTFNRRTATHWFICEFTGDPVFVFGVGS